MDGLTILLIVIAFVSAEYPIIFNIIIKIKSLLEKKTGPSKVLKNKTAIYKEDSNSNNCWCLDLYIDYPPLFFNCIQIHLDDYMKPKIFEESKSATTYINVSKLTIPTLLNTKRINFENKVVYDVLGSISLINIGRGVKKYSVYFEWLGGEEPIKTDIKIVLKSIKEKKIEYIKGKYSNNIIRPVGNIIKPFPILNKGEDFLYPISSPSIHQDYLKYLTKDYRVFGRDLEGTTFPSEIVLWDKYEGSKLLAENLACRLIMKNLNEFYPLRRIALSPDSLDLSKQECKKYFRILEIHHRLGFEIKIFTINNLYNTARFETKLPALWGNQLAMYCKNINESYKKLELELHQDPDDIKTINETWWAIYKKSSNWINYKNNNNISFNKADIFKIKREVKKVKKLAHSIVENYYL